MEFGWALRRPMRLPDSPRHERGLPAALRGVGVKPELYTSDQSKTIRIAVPAVMGGQPDSP
uniref:Uncharacterized protein K0116D04.30 n=1 Tax=Oryza sativa subsp. indica TaxID=39946 RepID=C8TFC4_ORYSI|nr:hypothetical protein [Oryza sativa Indica Group]BAI39877.1 hypothetical protein [Oryza sativa Indica Group]